MINKKIIIVTFSIFLFWQVSAESCKYESEIEMCTNAVNELKYSDWSFTVPWESIKDIEDFICIQDTYEKRALQIIMDLNFKEIDTEMDEYLENLSTQKDKFFAQDSEYSYYDWINEIWEKSEYFSSKYSEACSTTYTEALSCSVNESSESSSGETSGWSMSHESLIDYIWSNTNDSTWACYWLIVYKIDIFNKVAWNILLLNKQQVLRDEKKLYEQESRTKYDNLLDIMMINIWYMERIWQKWPSKIENAY